LAAELRLQSSTPGSQENGTNAWFWSGMLEAHGATAIEVSYHVASLKGVTYRVSAHSGNQVKHLRVAFQRRDLAAMRFESGDGTKRPTDVLVAWERLRSYRRRDVSGAISGVPNAGGVCRLESRDGIALPRCRDARCADQPAKSRAQTKPGCGGRRYRVVLLCF